MKSVLNIARAELRYMAFSPLAWGCSFILLFLFSSRYIDVLGSYVESIETGGRLDGLTYLLSTYRPDALMKQPIFMMGRFVLPFLFMSVISREFSSGTMRLIQSSPISERVFVWGKFLGLVGYVVGLMVAYAIILVVLSFTIVSPEISLLAWQLVVLTLYYFLIAAISLFASSLSSYALVCGVVAILLIIASNLLGNVGLGTPWGDFFYPLSHQAMADRLMSGGVDWNDVIMLLIFIWLFVQLTIVHLRSKSLCIAPAKRVMWFSLPIVGAFALIAMLPYTSINFTDVRSFKAASVHPKMQEILNELDEGPLEITHYFNIFFPPDSRKGTYIPAGQPATKYNVWRPFMRHKKDIQVRVKYYYALDTADYYTQMIVKAYKGKTDLEIARIMADTYGFPIDQVMSLEEAQQEVDIQGNEYIGHIIKLAYQDRHTLLLCPGDAPPDDRHYHAAMERLISGRGAELFFVRDGKPREVFHGTMEAGHLTDKQAPLIFSSWQQVGPPQDSVWLKTEDLPNDARFLVLLAPREFLSDTATNKIRRFIDGGGNLLLAGEPADREYIKPIMEYLGVAMKPGVVVQPTPDIGSSRLWGAFTPESFSHFSGMRSLVAQNKYFGYPTDTVNLVFDGAAGLDISNVRDFEVTPIVYSRAGRSWNRPIVQNYDSLQLVLDKQSTDEEGSFLLMAMLHREIDGRKQHILVSGDADFMKGLITFNSAKNEYGNGSNFIQDILTTMTAGQFPVDVKRPFLPDKAFLVTMSGVRIQEIILVYILPALLIVVGTYIILRRKRK